MRSFHPSNIIGRGSFGVVYKGILRDGTEVAIKSLSARSKQGTKILVYEYLENNSLANALLGSNSKGMELDWSKKAAIYLGTATGLEFLHKDVEPQIVSS
ncbi:Protein kinase superfamily protein [Perilla frutescens var. frutescens]|nr:Protein kinase superfamily protein [Perilla frutescens var. frutescens]